MTPDDSQALNQNTSAPPEETNGKPNDISLDRVVSPEKSRPLLVDKNIVSEIQADSLLAPMDQVYSPSTHIYGIRYVYRFISNATRSLMNNMRTHLPTKDEIDEGLRTESYKIGDLDKIMTYLTQKTPPNPAFSLKYYAALFEGDKLVIKPVFLAGNESIEKIIDKSDEVSARNIAHRAASLQPWSDKLTQGEFLNEKIKLGKFHETYFLGYFKFDEQDMSKECREVYERRILPLLKGRTEIIYLEVPRSLQLDEPGDEPVLLVNDHRDLKFRYEFISGKLIAGAKKIIQESGSNELAWQIRNSLDVLKQSKSPESIKRLAAAVLAFLKKPSNMRQIALEVFLMKERADEIIRQEIKNRESRNQMNLELLLKRIQKRKWLVLIPASFYPEEVFAEALSKPEVLGIKKSAVDLGASEDYYCIVESSLVGNILKVANWFELGIIEDILTANLLASKEYYKKSIFKKKKNIVFLIMNPFIYLFRILFTGKKHFIESTFRKEIDFKGKNYLKGLNECFEASGIRSESEILAERESRSKPTGKQLLMKQVLDIMFSDPAPSSKWINETEYREKLVRVARYLRQNEAYPQYNDKNDEAIIADIELFLKEELIEDLYTGQLPSGLDHRGRKFTRKIYSPKSIKDQPIVYESIREELEHESNVYGSKDLVEYYRARAKLYTESNMEKIRSSEKLKKEAEQKSRVAKENVIVEKAGTSKISSREPQKIPDRKAGKKSFFQREKKKSESPAPVNLQKLSSQQKISRTAGTLSSEMREKYITNKKFSGSNLFPISPAQMEELLDIEPGTLSLFSNQNSKDFTGHFTIIKCGKQYYYFPKKFFESNRDKVIKYYEELVKHESNLSLPNGEIIHKAQDIISAVKSKR